MGEIKGWVETLGLPIVLVIYYLWRDSENAKAVAHRERIADEREQRLIAKVEGLEETFRGELKRLCDSYEIAVRTFSEKVGELHDWCRKKA